VRCDNVSSFENHSQTPACEVEASHADTRGIALRAQGQRGRRDEQDESEHSVPSAELNEFREVVAQQFAGAMSIARLVRDWERDCEWLETLVAGGCSSGSRDEMEGCGLHDQRWGRSSARRSRCRERCSDEGAEEPCSSGGNPEDRDPNSSVWSVAPPVFLDIMGVRGADSFKY